MNKTACYELHIAAGGKMVEFAGYQMPVHYAAGIKTEHLHTRSQAGLFDVSHMGQVVVSGSDSGKALERILPIDVEGLALNHQCYAVFTNLQGGILDDLIVTRRGDNEFLLVVNAARKAQDIAYLKQHLANYQVEYQEQAALLALQGPKACEALAQLAPAAETLGFMQGTQTTLDGNDCFISRSGYTGEDGFEISVANQAVTDVAELLLANSAVKWIGLGARDSLRLESGLCLYGHDMSEQTTVVEAGLDWSISRRRRSDGEKAGGFPGADIIFAQQKDGAAKKRVGFTVDGRAPVREGTGIVDDNGNEIGIVTSGGFSPSLEIPIAMGYISSEYAAPGSTVQAMVRGKPRPMTVSKMPFVPQHYCRK